jgi:hypothetical protein
MAENLKGFQANAEAQIKEVSALYIKRLNVKNYSKLIPIMKGLK